MIDLRGSNTENWRTNVMFIFFLAFDSLFSLVSILLTWLVSQYLVGRSVWFAINAKEGDCWKMIEVEVRLLNPRKNVGLEM